MFTIFATSNTTVSVSVSVQCIFSMCVRTTELNAGKMIKAWRARKQLSTGQLLPVGYVFDLTDIHPVLVMSEKEVKCY